MFSKRSLEGYVLLDNRLAPPITPEQVKAAGHDPSLFSGLGRQLNAFESATVTCCHCGQVVILNPDRSRQRGHCRKCDQYICDNPACHLECRPLAQQFDEIETALRLAGSNGVSGLILPGKE